MDNQLGRPDDSFDDSPQGDYHKSLARQIRKHLGEGASISPELANLLKAVSETYIHADEDRRLIERSLEISSRELTSNYQRVKQQVDAQTSELLQRTQEAEDSQRTLQAILDNLPVGVLVVKAPSGQPIMMNRAGASITGVTTEESSDSAHYNTTFNLTKEDGTAYPNEDLPLTKTLLTGKTYMASDVFIRHPNGAILAVRAYTAPIMHSDGKFASAVAVFEDISEEKNLEHTRDEFFAIASHELRTPLTAIRGNTSMIMEYYDEAMKDPALAEMVQDIHESSVRLISIVNDFLDMSSLEQKRMKFVFTNFDIVELAESVIKEYETTSKAQGVSLVVHHPDSPIPPVYADKNRLKQVLINLVGNALKFTKQGSVSVSFANEGAHVKISVNDTGDGMTDEAKKMLFHKFEQTGVNPLTRDSVRGTGLGLYISRLLMDHMNGEISLVSSEVGKGSAFSVKVPFTAAGELQHN